MTTRARDRRFPQRLGLLNILHRNRNVGGTYEAVRISADSEVEDGSRSNEAKVKIVGYTVNSAHRAHDWSLS